MNRICQISRGKLKSDRTDIKYLYLDQIKTTNSTEVMKTFSHWTLNSDKLTEMHCQAHQT